MTHCQSVSVNMEFDENLDREDNKIKHYWGEISKPKAKTNGNQQESDKESAKKVMEHNLKNKSSIHKLIKLGNANYIRELDLTKSQDKNVMDSVKLVHEYYKSDLNMIGKEPAFVIADFTSDLNVSLPKLFDQTQPMQQGPNTIFGSPADARELLKRSVATLMMHSEILCCKSSALESMVQVAEGFFRQIGLLLAISTEDNKPLPMEEVETVMLNMGTGGVDAVLKHYTDTVVHHKIFLEASITRGIQLRDGKPI